MPTRREMIDRLREIAMENNEPQPEAPEANNPTFIPEPAHVFAVQVPIEIERPVDPRPIPADPIYERQASLINLEELPAVMIIGAGGVGCWIALALALGGVRYIDLFDGDSLSTHNLNRFPLPMSSVGSLKSEALASWLRELRPEAEIIARGMFDAAIHTRVADWLVCATDSLKSRRMCYDYAQRNGMRYLEVGADGERWTLSPSPPEFSTENEAQPGYQTVPVHVGPCMMAGAAAAYYVLHNTIPLGSHSMEWANGLLTGRWVSEVEQWDDAKGEVSIEHNEWTEEQAADHEAWIAAGEPEVWPISPFGAGTPNTLGAAERALDEANMEVDHGEEV